MKTITINQSKLSAYIFDDDEKVEMGQEQIFVGQPLKFIIGDLNANTSTLIENVTPPEDWKSFKYFFNGVYWTANPNWRDPMKPKEETK